VAHSAYSVWTVCILLFPSMYVLEQHGGLQYEVRPNVVVEWLALLLHIREVPGSNLRSETGYLY
jgi:hypothetical protein